MKTHDLGNNLSIHVRACVVYIVCSTDRNEYPRNENDVKTMLRETKKSRSNDRDRKVSISVGIRYTYYTSRTIFGHHINAR